MKTFRLSPRIALPVLLAALALPVAAQTTTPDATPAMPAAQQMQMGQGGGPGMRGMQGMRCPMMQGKGCCKKRHRHAGMGRALPMPRLPPGNDKLQLQMEAEILQKIGEIQGKYASQLP